MNKYSRAFTVCALMGAASALSACGAAEPQKPPGPKAIYTSASDCADGGLMNYSKCDEAISKAIASHDADSTAYPTERRCEANEGEGKCDRTLYGKFRPRVIAFLVTTGDEPSAIPLYPTTDGEEGFRDGSAKTYKEDDDYELKFSRSAVAAYELYWDPAKRRMKKR